MAAHNLTDISYQQLFLFIKPIRSTYSDLTNDYDDYGTTIDASLSDNEGVEDELVPNYENNDDKSPASEI